MPASWIALAVALLAVVPGFILATTWARARTWHGPSTDLRTVLQSLALSACVQVVISPLTVVWIVPVRDDLGDHAARLAVWFLLSVLLLPVLGGAAASAVTDWLLLRHGHPGKPPLRRPFEAVSWFVKSPASPSAWDRVFTEQVPDGRFVLVEFRDGSTVGGVFGAGSVAMTSPERQGLYLANEWLLDEAGDFSEPVPDSRGILIPDLSDVRFVRVLSSADEGGARAHG